MCSKKVQEIGTMTARTQDDSKDAEQRADRLLLTVRQDIFLSLSRLEVRFTIEPDLVRVQGSTVEAFRDAGLSTCPRNPDWGYT